VSRQHQHLDAAELLEAVIERIAQIVAEHISEKLLERQQPKPAAHGATHFDERTVSQRTGIAVKTLQSWRSHRRGPPFVRAGRKVLYPSEGLQDWLSGDSQEGTDTSVSAHVPTKRRARRVAAQEAS